MLDYNVQKKSKLNRVSRTRDDTEILDKTLIGRTVTPDVEASDTIDKINDLRADHEISVMV